MNFDDVAYLQQGNGRQRKAFAILTENQILSNLACFDPILVGTIPINIDIETSDLDIICCFEDKQAFVETVTDNFNKANCFAVRERLDLYPEAIIANFFLGNFEVEIFGQPLPTRQQLAYRHMMVEHKLLNQYGEVFRKQIVELKRQGYKTEPAFGVALGLEGDAYVELLRFETEQ